MADSLDITCPCCATKLVVDRDTGDVLSEVRPKTTDRLSFDEALEGVRSSGSRREQLFSKAFDRHKRQESLLDKKFEEARKKADDEDVKPINPFDFD